MLTGFAVIDEEEEKTEPAVGNSTASVASSQPQIVTYITKDGDTLDSIALAAWGRSLVQLSPRQQQELRLKVTLIALQDKQCDASELKVLPDQRVTLAGLTNQLGRASVHHILMALSCFLRFSPGSKEDNLST